MRLVNAAKASPHAKFYNLSTVSTESLLVRSQQAETIIVKRLVQECNNVTKVWNKPRSCDQGLVKKMSFPFRPRCRPKKATFKLKIFANFFVLKKYIIFTVRNKSAIPPVFILYSDFILSNHSYCTTHNMCFLNKDVDILRKNC